MFEQAKKVVDKAKKIYIVGHVNPDGDSIGSCFATYYIMKKLGKDVNVLIRQRSDVFDFLPGIDSAVSSVKEDKYDLLISLDSSSKDRLDLSIEDYNKAKTVLMLDHHKKSEPFGDVNCIKDHYPAASQIVYEFMEYLGVELDQEIATYIYTGIMTDTGSFNYSSTTSKTLEIASKLVGTGIDFSEICKKLNHTLKEGKLRLIAKTIDRMEVYFDAKVRYSYIDYDTIASLGLDDEDAEGMTNYLLTPRGTEVAVYVREKSDGTNKVSMRSAGNVNVANIAIAFGGGGHTRAAGYSMQDENTEKEKKELLKAIEVVLNDSGSTTN